MSRKMSQLQQQHGESASASSIQACKHFELLQLGFIETDVIQKTEKGTSEYLIVLKQVQGISFKGELKNLAIRKIQKLTRICRTDEGEINRY